MKYLILFMFLVCVGCSTVEKRCYCEWEYMYGNDTEEFKERIYKQRGV